MKILVLTNGFIIVAESIEFQGNYIAWPRALNLRKWGGGKGLGHIAYDGPTHENDKLDPEPAGRVHEMLCVRMIDVQPEAAERMYGLFGA